MKTIEAEAKRRLLSRREALKKLSDETARDDRQLTEDQPADWTDRATVREETSLLRELGEVERRELAEIDAALERIARGEFGRCEECAGAIGRQRLRAIPEARLCINCRERAEHAA